MCQLILGGVAHVREPGTGGNGIWLMSVNADCELSGKLYASLFISVDFF